MHLAQPWKRRGRRSPSSSRWQEAGAHQSGAPSGASWVRCCHPATWARGHGAGQRAKPRGGWDDTACVHGKPSFLQRCGAVGLVPPLPAALCLIQHPAGHRRVVKLSLAFRLLTQTPPSTPTVFPLRTFLPAVLPGLSKTAGNAASPGQGHRVLTPRPCAACIFAGALFVPKQVAVTHSDNHITLCG